MSPTKIPLLDLAAQNGPLRAQIRAAMDAVIDGNRFILGEEVGLFEAELAAYVGAKHLISCANGSDALVLALRALGIGRGDEVITTTFSFFATAGSIARVGATPVFVDIDPATYNLDPSLVAARITERTKAIMPVHLYGQMTPMADLMGLAAAKGLAVIEDAAQSLGAKEGERSAGTLGAVGTYSFFPSKNLGCFGDGGAMVTNDDALAERLRSLRVHGTGKVRYHYDHIGLNSRLDTLQAAILRVKLPHLEAWHEGRRRNARRYDEKLAGLVGTPAALPGMRHIYNQYTIRVADRDGLQKHLNALGIGNAVYYPMPLHVQGCFAEHGGKPGDCPHAERAAREVLSLPVYGELGEAELDRVVAAIAEFV